MPKWGWFACGMVTGISLHMAYVVYIIYFLDEKIRKHLSNDEPRDGR